MPRTGGRQEDHTTIQSSRQGKNGRPDTGKEKDEAEEDQQGLGQEEQLDRNQYRPFRQSEGHRTHSLVALLALVEIRQAGQRTAPVRTGP